MRARNLCLLAVSVGCQLDRELDQTVTTSGFTETAVGDERDVDLPIASSVTGHASQAGSIAFGPSQFLAVWQDHRAAPEPAAIFATRLATTGTVVDAMNLRISPDDAVGVQAEPAVAYVGDKYLVVWEEGGTGDLRAAHVAPSGVITQLGTLGTAGEDTRPRIAVRGRDAFVVFQSGDDVYGMLLSADAFGAPLPIATGASEPSVAGNPAGGYLVAFTTTAQTQLAARIVEPAADPASWAPPFAMATGNHESHQSDASFVAGNYVVVWGAGGQVLGARVDPATGAVLDTRDGFAHGGTTDQPRITCSPSAGNCFVAWRRHAASSADSTDVEGRLIDAALHPIATTTVLRGGIAEQSRPQLTPGSDGSYGAVYFDARGGTTGSVHGSVFSTMISGLGTTSQPDGVLLACGHDDER